MKQGQSIHHICIENVDEIMLDEKPIYNYIDAELLSVGNIDLPRKVRYRVQKKKKPVRVDKQCHVGRTYDDFQEFIATNPDVAIVEMDSVEGRKGGKVFLTIYFRSCSLMLVFIRDHNTARSVTAVFNRLYELLGHEVFATLFPVISRDRLTADMASASHLRLRATPAEICAFGAVEDFRLEDLRSEIYPQSGPNC